MQYPAPRENPFCQCRGNPLRAFWCRHGHLLECHYPFTCRQAACSHLSLYHCSAEELARLEAEARTALAEGKRAPYFMDKNGNIYLLRPRAKPP